MAPFLTGQQDLPVAFTKAGFAVLGEAIQAMGAGHAGLIAGIEAVVCRKGVTASVTKGVIAFPEPVLEADPAIKDKATALPEGLAGRNRFKVFQDPSLEVVDLFISHLPDQRGCFFAANPACAVHGNGLMPIIGKVFAGPCGKIPEGGGLGVDGSLETPDADFILIPGIDEKEPGIFKEGVPMGRINVFPDGLERVYRWLTEGDDLFFEPHLEAHKGRFGSVGPFFLEILERGLGAEDGHEGIEFGSGSGDGCIDALGGKEDRPTDGKRLPCLQEQLPQAGRVLKGNEPVET